MMIRELEDYPWFPQVLRKMQMDYIGWLVAAFRVYEPIVPLLAEQLACDDRHHIIDLCSGSGMPIHSIAAHLETSASVTCTDLYPRSGQVALDVLHLQASDIEGVVTMFNAFHHFSSEDQVNILSTIAAHDTPCIIVELLQPSLVVLLKVIITTTIGQLLLAPFVRPWSWWRLVCTYLLPVNLLTVTYDGIVSVLKSKTEAAYQNLAEQASREQYTFRALTLKGRFSTKLTIISGTPDTL